ncbi:hypothetical protein JYU11_02445 [bacterium AH-315-G05]|nr:hypothetical protein [Alkaliphilus sp. AH-315-G20]MBN4069746.1 hypothetical protein [bacterium AH-315-G05]
MINIFVSNFAEHLKNMRTLKHNAGFSLKYMDKHLNEFDCYCKKYFPDKKILDRNLVDSWVYYTTSKSIQEIEKRFRTMTHLANYMLAIGLESYVAQSFCRRVKPAEPHIFTDAQLKEFFANSDNFEQQKYPPYRHLVAPVIFRMIYCCGLRNSEACNIKCSEIDLDINYILKVALPINDLIIEKK